MMNTPTETATAAGSDAPRIIHPTPLAAKVAAVNRANAEANRLQPLFVEAFRPYLGKKILGHGGLIKRVQPIVDQLAPFKPDGYATPHVMRNPSTYTLTFSVKVCESSKGQIHPHPYQIASYHETSFTVGEMNNDARYELQKLVDWTPLRTDYTVEEIQNKRRLVEELDDKYRAALSALYPFERYDR